MKNIIHCIKKKIEEKEFKKEFKKFQTLPGGSRFVSSWEERKLINESTATTKFDRHYIYHTAWAARILAKNKPEKHIDISSALYFCSIVSAFIPIEFYDYRPAPLQLSNLTSKECDLLSIPFKDSAISSLSCMHVVEHVGLGRYGDELNPDADLKAISELKRVLAPGDSLLFVVPIGKPRIMFNAHRIYSYEQIMKYFSELELKEFSLLCDSPGENGLIVNATKELSDQQKYGMGCFWFKKSL